MTQTVVYLRGCGVDHSISDMSDLLPILGYGHSRGLLTVRDKLTLALASTHKGVSSAFIDLRGEAPSLRHFGELIYLLRANGIKKITIATSGIDTPSTDPTVEFVSNPYTFFSDGYVTRTMPTFDIPATHHFVSLSRIPRIPRIISTVELFKRNLNKHGVVSLGSGEEHFESHKRGAEYVFSRLADSRLYSTELLNEVQDRFPILVDGTVPVGISGDDKQRDVTNPLFTGAMISVVNESSFEHIIGIDTPQSTRGRWSEKFVTEKTIKTFVIGQIPIMITVPGMVAELRGMGFDMFDDIIDHSYDQVQDPIKRIECAIDQLEKFVTRYPVTQLTKLRIKIRHRLKKNYQRVIELADHNGCVDLEISQRACRPGATSITQITLR